MKLLPPMAELNRLHVTAVVLILPLVPVTILRLIWPRRRRGRGVPLTVHNEVVLVVKIREWCSGLRGES